MNNGVFEEIILVILGLFVLIVVLPLLIGFAIAMLCNLTGLLYFVVVLAPIFVVWVVLGMYYVL